MALALSLCHRVGTEGGIPALQSPERLVFTERTVLLPLNMCLFCFVNEEVIKKYRVTGEHYNASWDSTSIKPMGSILRDAKACQCW